MGTINVPVDDDDVVGRQGAGGVHDDVAHEHAAGDAQRCYLDVHRRNDGRGEPSCRQQCLCGRYDGFRCAIQAARQALGHRSGAPSRNDRRGGQ
jgi:hypothetical protein